MTRITFIALAVSLASCGYNEAQPGPSGPPQFTIGPGYQAGGEWLYPHNFPSYNATGLSEIQPPDHPPATTDNETYDPNSLTAASPVLQLPAIATITNLQNGYAMDVRINDRGPTDNPGRIISVTPKVASLLDLPENGATEVEVVLKPTQTAALDATLGQGPKLTAAPIAAITAQNLGPPGAASDPSVQNLGAQNNPDAGPDPTTLSGQVTVTTPSPGPLFVEIPGFGRPRDATNTLGALAGLPASIVPMFGGDRVLYAVRLGPYTNVADADAALQQVLQRGIADPEIIVR